MKRNEKKRKEKKKKRERKHILRIETHQIPLYKHTLMTLVLEIEAN
jgi:hypothetical protein